jgi:3-methyladenine DNA glycosylase/8-oxoguanine DNA glycosylase
LAQPFDLARTAAPVWWSGGRSPNADWNHQTLYWVGREGDRVVWRSVRQVDALALAIDGSASEERDADWADAVLAVSQAVPIFRDPVLVNLSSEHEGFRSWSAGSLFEGFVSTIVGQSISVAAAATTERRLCELFNAPIDLNGRRFWPAPTPEQLASASPDHVRASGVTRVRAEALVAVATKFATGEINEPEAGSPAAAAEAEKLRAIRGVGPWTVQSALLWGIGAPDAHPTGDIALLRAAQRHYPGTDDLRALDRLAETWAPSRGWAARLLWLDLLGFEG